MYFFELFNFSTNGLSIVSNIILFILSINIPLEVIPELGWFTTNNSIAGTIFSCLLLFLQPQFITIDSVTIRIPHGPSQTASEITIKLLAAAAVLCFLYNLLSFSFFFVYRTVILVNNSKYMRWLNRRGLLLTFVAIFLFSATNASIYFLSTIPAEDLKEKYWNEIVNSTDKDAILLFNKVTLFGEDYQQNHLIVLFYFLILMTFIISYAIVFVCVNIMAKILRTKQNTMSSETLRRNFLLTNAVLLEACLPLFFTLPIFVSACFSEIFKGSVYWQEYLGDCLICFIPLVNALISIYVFTPYKETIQNILSFKYFKNNVIVKQPSNDLEDPQIP